jgi:hypothetical protein
LKLEIAAKEKRQERSGSGRKKGERQERVEERITIAF